MLVTERLPESDALLPILDLRWPGRTSRDETGPLACICLNICRLLMSHTLIVLSSEPARFESWLKSQ